MPLDHHTSHFLETLAAAGHLRGRYQDAEQRRAALIELSDIADRPGGDRRCPRPLDAGA
jgi:hypothetical protein